MNLLEFALVAVFNDGLTYFQESLDQETVKDVLEGDNKYTCSHCQEKVRAEKRFSKYVYHFTMMSHCLKNA